MQDDRFLLLGRLGRGGMSSVFRAFDRIEERVVALKVVDGEPLRPAHPLCSEFAAWSRLSHPNIVRAYELATARRGPLPRGAGYLVLEHVAGAPAHRSLAPGRVDGALLESLAVDVLRALAHVHEAGLVHRDLKPDNLLVRRRGRRLTRVKLTDFGLAARRGWAEPPGVFTGSLPYAAPEALLGAGLDGRSDLYSLGIVLYQLATGRMPVPGGGVDRIVRWHLTGEPADPGLLRSELPRRLARFVRRLTSRRPDERPTGAREALALLGVASPVSCPRRPATSYRAHRARLRLALDAVRRGARRTVRLPAGLATALGQEARGWSEARGVRYVTVGPGLEQLCRAALLLLVDGGAGTAELVRRHGLERVLPLRLVGDVAVLDHAPGRPAVEDGTCPATARRIAAFLLDAASRSPTVLRSASRSPLEPLVRETLAALALRIAGQADPRRGRAGLLLLVGGDAAVSPATRPGTPVPG